MLPAQRPRVRRPTGSSRGQPAGEHPGRHGQAVQRRRTRTAQIKATKFQNDAYKTKIKTAIGAGQGPTIIWGWGGGGLREYVKNDQVVDLTSFFAENAARQGQAVPGRVRRGDRRRQDLRDAGRDRPADRPLLQQDGRSTRSAPQPPQSWGDIMGLVDKFNAAGIAPFSLGGQSRWTNMMWLEFLLDRQAGPEVFQNVFDGKPDAWSDPAVTDMLTKVQDLVKANGFIKGFSSITADSNADQALLYTGKAAMMLHGAWTYGSMKASGGDFVTGGHLGYMNFPAARGRQGRPDQHRRQPGPVLLDLLQGHRRWRRRRRRSSSPPPFSDDTEVDEWIEAGNVPIVKGADAKLGVRQGRRVPQVRLRHLGQRQDLRPVLGPGAAADRRRDAARQHRQAVPAVDHPAAVDRQHERGHRQVTTLAAARRPAGATPTATVAGRRHAGAAR